MIAAPHHVDRSETVSEPFNAQPVEAMEMTELSDLPLIWDDCGLAELILREEGLLRDALLNQLAQLMISSLSGYQEIADLAENTPWHSFAEIMVRQRGAQCQELLHETQHWIPEAGEGQDVLAALRSAWRLAIWNFEQHDENALAAYAERAESLLEETCLAVANVLRDDDWGEKLRQIALSIYGARNMWEEIGDRVYEANLTDATVVEDQLVLG